MTQKRIEIVVNPEGAVSIKAVGFSGVSCKDATRGLENALGVAGRETLQPEYFQQGNTGQSQIQQGT